MISVKPRTLTVFLVGALASHLLSCFSLVEAWSALGLRKAAFRHLGKHHRQEGNSVSSLDYRREPSTDDRQITTQSEKEIESSIKARYRYNIVYYTQWYNIEVGYYRVAIIMTTRWKLE